MPRAKDIRSIITEQAMIDAVEKLLRKETFDNITVNEICIEAAISRTTFYLHFADKYELMVRYIQDAITFQIEKFKIGEDNLEEVFDNLLQECYKRRDIFAILRNSKNANRELKHKIDSMFYDVYYAYFEAKSKKGIVFGLPIEGVARYYCGAVSDVIGWWIETDCATPIPALNKFISDNIMSAK